MTSAETKKAPVAPTTGTTAEAAPTAPTNTESSRNETDRPMFAPAADNRQQLEPTVRNLARICRVSTTEIVDSDALSVITTLHAGDHSIEHTEAGVYTTFGGVDYLNPVDAAEYVELVALVAEVARILSSYANPDDAARDLLGLVPAPHVENPGDGGIFVALRERFGIDREAVERASGMKADLLRRVEEGDIRVSVPATVEITRAILEAADEPASAQLRRPVEACAAPEHEGLL